MGYKIKRRFGPQSRDNENGETRKKKLEKRSKSGSTAVHQPTTLSVIAKLIGSILYLVCYFLLFLVIWQTPQTCSTLPNWFFPSPRQNKKNNPEKKKENLEWKNQKAASAADVSPFACTSLAGGIIYVRNKGGEKETEGGCEQHIIYI
jgi:hypothetical protein